MVSGTGPAPNQADTVAFWRGLWSEPVNHSEGPWTEVVASQCAGITPMDPVIITPDDVAEAVRRAPNWKSPGLDGLHHYRLKGFMIGITDNEESDTENLDLNAENHTTNENENLHWEKIIAIDEMFAKALEYFANTNPTERQFIPKQRSSKKLSKIVDYVNNILLPQYINSEIEFKTFQNLVYCAEWTSAKLNGAKIEIAIQVDNPLGPEKPKKYNKPKWEQRLENKEEKKLSHLLYMDDLKLYATTQDELDQLVILTEKFSRDIGMEFGIDKCNINSVRAGQYYEHNYQLQTGQQIKSLEENGVYKAKGGETGGFAYWARMHRLFAELEPSVTVTEQNLADRVRYILRSNTFDVTELERLRREAVPSSGENAAAEDAAPQLTEQTANVDAAVNTPVVVDSDDDGTVAQELELEQMGSTLEEAIVETRSTPLENRPRLPRLALSKRNRAVVRALNPMLVTYLEASQDLCETDSILFGAALAVCRIIGAKLSTAGRATGQSSAIPAWRIRIEERIAKARALIGRLICFRSGNTRPRIVRTAGWRLLGQINKNDVYLE
ncbi:unnamed protein product [Parnassius apollo]|uniref:(apollo) hypothetical protein n=1 Tax=Parnassius apollo TaxID=110799 RepID=A0A8S3WLR5_PARAO|nr:unnamed protein product [Parnassius apollo]